MIAATSDGTGTPIPGDWWCSIDGELVPCRDAVEVVVDELAATVHAAAALASSGSGIGTLFLAGIAAALLALGVAAIGSVR